MKVGMKLYRRGIYAKEFNKTTLLFKYLERCSEGDDEIINDII